MTFECELTTDDIVAFNLDVWRHVVPLRRVVLRALSAGFLTFLLLSILLWPFAGRKALAFGVPYGVGMGVVMLFAQRGSIIRRTRAIQAKYPDPQLFGKKTYHMDDSGISQESPGSSCSISWRQVREVVFTENHLFIYLGPFRAFVIPTNGTLRGASRTQILDEVRARNLLIRETRSQYVGA